MGRRARENVAQGSLSSPFALLRAGFAAFPLRRGFGGADKGKFLDRLVRGAVRQMWRRPRRAGSAFVRCHRVLTPPCGVRATAARQAPAPLEEPQGQTQFVPTNSDPTGPGGRDGETALYD